ncbi:VPS4 protein [Gonium pectorale]|uniref:VPS4 protein n=1 Tax=Gonium pectorale TaxID=33097 RepID=A0A150GCF6_GONPE|nr:VPS4 protein [Gonium pectorale]|eukprot:KXZ47532.1 VPS4 protein [Gonium pectorale]
MRILQEFEESYELKFGKRPKVVRRLVEEVAGGGGAVRPRASSSAPGPSSAGAPPRPAGSGGFEGPPVSGAVAARQRRDAGAAAAAAEAGRRAELLERRQVAMNCVKPPPEVGMQRIAGVVVDGRGPLVGPGGAGAAAGAGGGGAGGGGGGGREDPLAGLHVAGQAANIAPSRAAAAAGGSGSDSDPDSYFERRVLKPLPPQLQGELRDLGAALSRDIFTENPAVRWDDIAGLEGAKRLIKEAVVMPIKYPQLFTGLLAPWKGVLLYGPPGTGKTLLAKAVATECRTTFFNISASSIISKWRGDSEKLVRVLFELARYHAPSTVFLDEIDALMGARGGEGEHEASRRMKTELLIQMDGLARGGELVFVLAATNMPWELDMAMLRRLEKRILVPLPNTAARRAMFSTLLAGRCAADVSPDMLAERTEGYSGSDVAVVAKEAAMRPLRRLMSKLELDGPVDPHAKLELGPITVEDARAALEVTKPSARLLEERYRKFNEEYGQQA